MKSKLKSLSYRIGWFLPQVKDRKEAERLARTKCPDCGRPSVEAKTGLCYQCGRYQYE